MKHKVLAIFILIISIISLTACSNKIDNTEVNEGADRISTVEKVETGDAGETGDAEPSSKPEYSYATDNKNRVKYVAGKQVYADEVELAEPYKLEYTEQSIHEEPVEEIEESEEFEESEESEEIPDNDEIEAEEANETDEVEIGTQEETEYTEVQGQVVNEIRDIVNSIYFNGYTLLDNCKSVDEFNKNHDISMDSVISTLKRGLENLEYCDSLINYELSIYDNVVSSWGKLYKDFSNYQSLLAEVETAEDYIRLGISGQLAFKESFMSFIAALNTV